MTALHNHTKSSLPGKDNPVDGPSASITQFLRDASQILATTNLVDSPWSSYHEPDHDSDSQDQNDQVVWRLDLSPESIALDTTIQTIAGLEKVLNQLRKHVDPHPHSPSRPPAAGQDLNMTKCMPSVAIGLYLSCAAPLPQPDLFRQFNSMHLMQQCVHVFVMSGNALFLDGPRLLRDTGKVLSHPAASQTYPVETLLILSICSLTVRQVVVQNHGHLSVATGLMHTYARHARMLFQEVFDTPHIAILQSALILSLCPSGHLNLLPTSPTQSSLLSMTLRLALAMDLHQLDRDSVDSSSGLESELPLQQAVETEYRRRLAWMVLCADYFADWNTRGKGGCIRTSEWHVNFPQPLPHEPPRAVELLTQFCRIVMLRKMDFFQSICRHALQHTSPPATSSDPILNTGYMTPPDTLFMDLDHPPAQPGRRDVDALLLHALYLDTRIAACVPFLPAACHSQLDSERAVCESDAHSILQQLQRPLSSRVDMTQLRELMPRRGEAASNVAVVYSAQLEQTSLNRCALATAHYTRVLELLVAADPMLFFHTPVHGMLLTTQVYTMLEKCQDPDVVMLCRVNLARTWHLLQQIQSVLKHAGILYLQRMLTRRLPNGPSATPDMLLRNAVRLQHILQQRCHTYASPQVHTAINTPSSQEEDVRLVKSEST